MKTFSYTLSQKKQKKIKISNTNRDPYLNYPTLISSNYNNLSGVRIREYIELGNVSINFINYFNDFITNTGTQDLSNFFGIEIKSITINLKQLLNNSDNVNINNTELKPFFEEKLMIVNEKYKNNYNFIPSNEIQYIKIMKDVEPFNIDKNYKKSLNSFILSNDDDNSKIDLFKDLLYELNIITNNPINFLKIDDENIFNNLNMDDKKNNLLNSIELHPINFKSMIINEKNNNFNDKDNTYFINFDTELNNSHKMIDDINEKDNDINIIKNYNFKINETTQNNLFDDIIDNENIIDDIFQSDLNINIKRENVNELNFLKTIDNDDSNKKNINKNINFDFNLKLNYNFDKLIFINDTSNENNNINDNYINDTNNNKNDNENIIKENNNFTSSYNFKNNLQYLNINEPLNTNNYSDDTALLNNLKINNKLNNKLNMTSINSENIKIYAKENEEKILFSKLNSNMSVNVNNFIPKETIDNKNIIDHSDLNMNIKRENMNELNFLKIIDNDNYINNINNNKNDDDNEINNVIKENNNFASSYNFKNNLQYLNINEPSNTNNYSDNYSDNSPSLNNLKINNKLNNKLNMTSINSENIKIYAKENEEKILFSKLNSNIEVNINNFIPKETIDNKNITNNNKNSINNNKNDINNNKNSTNNNKNDDKNEINNVIKENNNFTLSSYNFKNNLQYLNINKPSNTNNYSDNTPLLNNLKINNKLNMTSINSENIKIYTKENEEKILFSKLNSNIAVNVNNFIPKETIDIKNIHKIQSDLELNINIDNPDKFNNFLNNSLINTDDVLKEKQKQYILNGLKMTTKYIINVYQLIYNENRLATGLGDFIRGSYFLMEFCKKYNFKYFIDFSNHPVKIFLKKYNKSQLNEKIKNIYKKINKCELDNFNPVIDNNKFINNYSNKQIHFNFLEYLSNQEKNKENIFIYTITFPNEGLINNYKKIMQDILEPTNKINLLVNIKLKILDLKQYSYEVIHIRCGDEYLSDKIINSHQININFILSELNELNPNKKYLLISDNNNIKSFIKKKYNFINILYNDIVHTGEKNEINLKQLENTILDFYLISKSKNVMSYSVYQHGSGFSKWCAFTYDIPYYCKYFGK